MFQKKIYTNTHSQREKQGEEGRENDKANIVDIWGIRGQGIWEFSVLFL